MALLPLVRRALGLSLLLATTPIVTAQESPAPSPTPVVIPKTVRLSFLPPPLDGAISLGIYDAKGKLVRVLHREADIEDFDVGSDALSTTWDGKNDAGEALPAGKYHARGYVVGDLLVEGVGFFFNDWVAEDQALHITKITGIAVENGVALFAVQLPGNKSATVVCDGNGNAVTTGEARVERPDCQTSDLSPLIAPLACSAGKDGTRWIIDRVSEGSAETEVKQFSADKELHRGLRVSATDPQPRDIAASKDADTIFLLEESAAMQRVRGLTLLATKSDQGQSVSDWKVDFAKEIRAHKDFTIDNGKPVLVGGKSPPDKIVVRLQANPLQKDEKRSAEFTVGYDAGGSFLQTADGLPLQSISETPHLIRAVLSPGSGNSVDVFQDDEAVVEQFRIGGLDRMMAFDCGEFELK